MVDFLIPSVRYPKQGIAEIYPDFDTEIDSSDLMIRGGDFYAVWCEDKGLWSTNEKDVIRMVDNELFRYAEEYKEKYKDQRVVVKTMRKASTGSIDTWHKYCSKQLRDNFHMLNEKLVYSNDSPNKKDYASKRLPYPLEPCPIPNYDRLMSVIYEPEEREKIEWAIGSIITGDSKYIQKFLVLYGDSGTGKSTILNIIQKLFDGYYCVFDAKALGSRNNQFALEPFKTNPLVGIQHDGDLSRIEDNTQLNSLVSHELMPVNEKFQKLYSAAFKCFLFMGTNRPVKITDAKSGILRRLIDVTPSGNKVPVGEYRKLVKGIDFELGGIACHCRDVYLADPSKYDDYTPTGMMEASNDFYNFMLDSYVQFSEADGVSLKNAWSMYKVYCDDAKVPYPLSKMIFKEELKAYFTDVLDRYVTEDGSRVWNYYSGFKKEKFESEKKSKKKKGDIPKAKETKFLDFKEQHSIFDDICKDCPAQYATKDETPSKAWDSVKTSLGSLDTSKLHYVKIPENHIVIDFDIPDENGNKCLEKNLEAASKWPPTYAELSKSGQGIHLHYIYTGGDPNKLSRIYEDHIEIKVYPDDKKSSLRRKLTKCNDIPIANINSGLPLKGEKKNVINFEGFKSVNQLRTSIKRNLNKENDPHSTKSSIDYIYNDLERAFQSGMAYDVSDMRQQVWQFAAASTNQKEYCKNKVLEMKFKSAIEPEYVESEATEDRVIFDVEVYPNLFVICWKVFNKGDKVFAMVNPKPVEVQAFMQQKLVGFNNKGYDNFILYAAGMLGYNTEQLFNLSRNIIVDKNRNPFGKDAKDASYSDVYEYSSIKKSLKAWEVDLYRQGKTVHHKEMDIPWDKPVPEELWDKVVDYCKNDVLATEAVVRDRESDFEARKLQVDICKKLHGITNVSVNDSTNTLSQRIVFGNNRTPQGEFNYRDLSKPVPYTEWENYRDKYGYDYKFRVFDRDGLPTYEDYTGQKLPSGYSILPFFPGYEFRYGKSTYLGEEIGEGGRVYSEPGMYANVDAEDVTSMHPTSIIQEVLFGPEYTKRFKELYDARIAIKRKDFAHASQMLGGVLTPYLNEENASDVAQALKIVINSVYGLTSASFTNPFRDDRNKDNIVAKRGALFMTLLKREVQKRGYSVVHIKTDCIKIPNATQEIVDFVRKFGAEYGYSFETEHMFDKFCLVNDAVYIGKVGNEWVAVGAQFQVPYVYKSLFTHESITFDDMCEKKQVTTTLYLDMNEKLPDVKDLEKQVDKLEKSKKKYNGHLLRAIDDDISKLKEEIKKGHDYHFVGRIGLFCPVKPGCGGGILVRQQEDKYNSVTGTKGYRWMESDMIKQFGLEEAIDRSYYDNLVNDAVDAISKYGDFEWFTE